MAGGINGERVDFPPLDVAAQIAVLGLDPLPYLTTQDDTERAMYIEIAKRAQNYREMLNKALAIEIANAVGKMLGG